LVAVANRVPARVVLEKSLAISGVTGSLGWTKPLTAPGPDSQNLNFNFAFFSLTPAPLPFSSMNSM